MGRVTGAAAICGSLEFVFGGGVARVVLSLSYGAVFWHAVSCMVLE